MNSEPAKMIGVSNTGPLISAFQCNRVDLIKRYYEHIYIVPGQVEEFERHGAKAEIEALIAEGFVIVEELTPEEKQQAESVAQQIAASPLVKRKEAEHHLSEAQALTLMARPTWAPDRILLEERAAREVARAMGLRVTGFIGILVAAQGEGILTGADVRSLLMECRQQGTRYSLDLIEEVSKE